MIINCGTFIKIIKIIGRTAKSVTKLLIFSGLHIWRWIPTIPTTFPTVSYSDVTFSMQVQRPGYPGNFWLKIMAESDEQMSVDGQVSSVVSAAPDSLEAVASSSNTSFNHPNVS